MKVCVKCDIEKELNQFYRNKRSTDGHINVCIKCKVAMHELRKAAPSLNSRLLKGWRRAAY